MADKDSTAARLREHHVSYVETIDRLYREQCAWQQAETDRLIEEMERRLEWQRILYSGLSQRTRMRAYDRMVGRV